MNCNFCNADIFIKTIQYSKPILAPASEVGVLRQKIQDMTGEAFVILPKRYCPMCGAKLAELKGERNA